MAGLTRLRYGGHEDQFGELSLPEGAAVGTVVIVHGGFWRQAYTLDLGRPLARDLVARGWACWNIEYRRVGRGADGRPGAGGDPATVDDVAAAIDALAGRDDVPLGRVLTLGHSAGGHLATWAAARGRHGWPTRVGVTGVIAQAGVLDLARARADGLGSDAVGGLTSGREPRAALDPARQLPLDVPVWCVHARDDDVVPFSQSSDYVDRAVGAGATATLVEVPGGHFGVIDPHSMAWRRIVDLLEGLSA